MLKQSPRKTHPREENSYRNMISRCYNSKATGYQWYGGKGVQVDPAWKESFWAFYKDMGTRPEGTSLDRVDPHGNYTKENCRWATRKEQGNNTTTHFLLEYDGTTKNLSQWGEELGILPNTLYYRLVRGWEVGEALEKVPRKVPWLYSIPQERLEWAVAEVAGGRKQTDVCKDIGLHSSQLSRICAKYKTKTKAEKKKKC